MENRILNMAVMPAIVIMTAVIVTMTTGFAIQTKINQEQANINNLIIQNLQRLGGQ